MVLIMFQYRSCLQSFDINTLVTPGRRSPDFRRVDISLQPFNPDLQLVDHFKPKSEVHLIYDFSKDLISIDIPGTTRLKGDSSPGLNRLLTVSFPGPDTRSCGHGLRLATIG